MGYAQNSLLLDLSFDRSLRHEVKTIDVTAWARRGQRLAKVRVGANKRVDELTRLGRGSSKHKQPTRLHSSAWRLVTGRFGRTKRARIRTQWFFGNGDGRTDGESLFAELGPTRKKTEAENLGGWVKSTEPERHKGGSLPRLRTRRDIGVSKRRPAFDRWTSEGVTHGDCSG
jgi:hypothetical protein